MQSTRYTQDVKRRRPEWVTEAAARAERRLASGKPAMRRHDLRQHQSPPPLDSRGLKAFTQVQQLVSAIMNPGIRRPQLRKIARAIISEGRS